LIKASAPAKAVTRSSSLILALPMVAAIAFLADLTMISKTPPKWGLERGLKLHFIPRLLNDFDIFDWPMMAKSSANSFLAKFS